MSFIFTYDIRLRLSLGSYLSFRTPLCVLFSPCVIACGSYMLCLHSVSPDYPLSILLHDSHAIPIYEAFDLSGSEAAQVNGEYILSKKPQCMPVDSIFRCRSIVAGLLRQHPTPRIRQTLAIKSICSGAYLPVCSSDMFSECRHPSIDKLRNVRALQF